MEAKSVVIFDGPTVSRVQTFDVWTSKREVTATDLESVEGCSFAQSLGQKGGYRIHVNPCYNVDEVKAAIAAMIEAK